MRDNDGRDLYEETVLLEADLLMSFGGWTKHTEPTLGAWLNVEEGQRHTDRCWCYWVALRPDQLPLLRRHLQEFRSRTLQKSIYLEVAQSTEVELIV